ncbi:hypothetical protein [Flavobacterium sp. K5-23]|uniref:hypothetical protein n=1 Tax=Flavobacterium sp. K5-23 TaxID=2746225 RepID=UPI00200BE44E|nr:hypothetical protein [Flavobacterium sp. K5-23]UQD55220.1 hypothetical protein FLAK523_01970 [Flavobacterium sp. K5-23]
MKKITLFNIVFHVCFVFFMMLSVNVYSQVGIGTITPNASSVLDVSSTTQGMLTPRMTTAQRIAIASPANGLMVYDTDLKAFHHYDTSTTSWVKISSSADGRLAFKRIKSTDVLATVLATELAAGGSTKYLFDTNTYYEINGTVTFNLPIDLNNAYVSGLDANVDKLVKTSGDLFVGAKGGTVKIVTIAVTGAGSRVFNVDCLSPSNLQTMVVRDCIIANSVNVGILKNFNMVFFSIVNFSGNTNGIIFENATTLLLSNLAWFGNNAGIYEKYVGTFGMIQKVGGFMDVTSGKTGVDVSANPTITNNAQMSDIVFYGTGTTGTFVVPYTVGGFTGYNFNNKWRVNCAGIPREDDAVATGDVNFDYAVGSGVTTTFSGSTKIKLVGNTTSNNLFRFSTDALNNRLKYTGSRKRYFAVSGALSFQSSAASTTYIVYIAKNGTVINQSKVYVNSNSSSDIIAIPIVTTVELTTNDYIEVFAERFTGSGNMLTVSLNLVVN